MPKAAAQHEALELSAELLRNIELNELPLANAALKASRLARLVGDVDNQRIFEMEAGGYPNTPTGVPQDVWSLAVFAGRSFQTEDPKTKNLASFAYLESIEELEKQVAMADAALDAARDPDVAISSANPEQIVWSPHGNFYERQTIRQSASAAARRLASRRAYIHGYVLRTHYKLKFSGIAQDVFARVRTRVDHAIGQSIPLAVQKLAAAYENLASENPEDWSNAVHSCRRILQDLADALFAPRPDVTKIIGGTQTLVKLGKEQYINRLVAFVEERCDSERFSAIVGSHLRFLCDRLDSVFRAAQKGSHSQVGRDEADRYLVYTYLVVGDILSLQ